MRIFSALTTLAILSAPLSAQQIPDIPWAVHDTARPRPPVVTPGPVPSDATVLFNGTSLDHWRSPKGGAATWQISDGAMVAVPGAGDIETADSLGDVQLHVEWMTPRDAKGGQNSGNSGVYLMKHYEVQVLNSYQNDTYPDGQAAAVYGQYPPLVNASRPPGEWQSYDIVFRAPKFDAEGRRISPAIVTVFHNGVVVQDHAVLTGPTAHRARPPYEAHPAKLPLLLQDHGEAVRYRNIWVRELR